MYNVLLDYKLITVTDRLLLTVNSPVFGSNPTCTVCSKSRGEEIVGRGAFSINWSEVCITFVI